MQQPHKLQKREWKTILMNLVGQAHGLGTRVSTSVKWSGVVVKVAVSGYREASPSGLWHPTALVGLPALPSYCESLGSSLPFPVPRFLIWKTGLIVPNVPG